MAKTYKKYGVTTGGYRGERAILQERVIEGLEETSFQDQRLQLQPNSAQTIYLTNNNMAEGNYIILPKASDLWPNWQVAIINESSFNCRIYYYTEDYTQLNLFKEATSDNMITCILLDDTTIEGTWTTLRTIEQSSIDLLDRYVSDAFEEVDILFSELQQDTSTIVRRLGDVLTGTSVKSVYIKTTEAFAGDNDRPVTLNLTVGKGNTYTAGYDYTQDAEYDADYFTSNYDLTAAVSDSNFTKDLFDEILSTSADKQVLLTFTGTNLQYLTAGSVKIVVEKAKVIDPTVLKNPIVQTQIPIGVIMNYSFPDIPEGYWRLDGSIFPNAVDAIPQFTKKLISMNNQQPSTAKLIVGEDEWQQIKAQYGSCSKFAWNGSGLRFPEINCFVQGLNSINQLSKMMEAGLPDHTHSPLYIEGSYDDNGDAGRYALTDPSRYWGLAEQGYTGGVREEGVWGKSDTVQPTSIRYPYIISIYNKIQNSATLDLEEILEDSVYKANVSLDNLNQDGIDFLNSKAKQVTESNCVPDMSSGVSFSSGTQLPCNALVVISGNPGWYNTINLYVDGQEVYCAGVSENSQRHKAGNVIAKKGATITYTGSVSSAYYYPLG